MAFHAKARYDAAAACAGEIRDQIAALQPQMAKYTEEMGTAMIEMIEAGKAGYLFTAEQRGALRQAAA